MADTTERDGKAMTTDARQQKRRNNYYSKPRRSVNMWVIYYKLAGEGLYFPRTDVHGHAIAYTTKSSAAAALYETRQLFGAAYLQKIGPIS